jgi:hypothetical protein
MFRNKTRGVARKVGLRRIERELDVVRFLRKQFIMTALLKALTTKRERMLAKRHHSLVISDNSDTTQSSESECASDNEFDK